EQVLGESAMLLGDRREQLLLELLRVDLAHALVLSGDHDVDAVRLVADVLVDPVELDRELSRLEADRAEHAEASCLADGGDDVATVTEREDRELDAEPITERCAHGDLAVFESKSSTLPRLVSGVHFRSAAQSGR